LVAMATMLMIALMAASLLAVAVIVAIGVLLW
jgi:hypothetical protein